MCKLNKRTNDRRIIDNPNDKTTLDWNLTKKI